MYWIFLRDDDIDRFPHDRIGDADFETLTTEIVHRFRCKICLLRTFRVREKAFEELYEIVGVEVVAVLQSDFTLGHLYHEVRNSDSRRTWPPPRALTCAARKGLQDLSFVDSFPLSK